MKPLFNNRLVQHLLFWCFYFVLFYLQFRGEGQTSAHALAVAAVSLPHQLFFTYSQLRFLVPKFLVKKKVFLYVLLSILFSKIAIDISIITYQYILLPQHTGNPTAMPWEWLYTITPTQIFPFSSMLPIAGIAVAIKLWKKWYLETEKNEQILREKMRMELEMLKAQVHPHFLFNTLNNLYSLTLTRSGIAPTVVTHLSGLLRYILYECNEHEVPLENEIAAVRKYVELEKLRYGHRVEISFSCSGDTSRLRIAPLLLLPFIENSFKHGISEQLDPCWISLHIHAERNTLSFTLSNSCFKENDRALTGGIGLHNIRKRLALLYDGEFRLNISQDEEMYLVRLTMQLSKQPRAGTETKTSFSHSLYADVHEN